MSALVNFARLPHGKGLPLPAYESAGAAGIDLRAAQVCSRDLSLRSSFNLDALYPGEIKVFSTGFAVAIADGFEGQVRGRSSLAMKGLSVVHGVGTIDSDYRGEVFVFLVNHGSTRVGISQGERIAQLVVSQVARAVIAEVTAERMTTTERGANGFGSTGVR